MAAKRKKQHHHHPVHAPSSTSSPAQHATPRPLQSRFFSSPAIMPMLTPSTPAAGPSASRRASVTRADKENVRLPSPAGEDRAADAAALDAVVFSDEPEAIEEDDGRASLSPDRRQRRDAWDTPEFSSPVRARRRRSEPSRRASESDSEADVLSSPPAEARTGSTRRLWGSGSGPKLEHVDGDGHIPIDGAREAIEIECSEGEGGREQVLVRGTPPLASPDLADAFGDADDIEMDEDRDRDHDGAERVPSQSSTSAASTSSSAALETPRGSTAQFGGARVRAFDVEDITTRDDGDEDIALDIDDDTRARAHEGEDGYEDLVEIAAPSGSGPGPRAAPDAIVARGWWAKWALDASTGAGVKGQKVRCKLRHGLSRSASPPPGYLLNQRLPLFGVFVCC
jgi:hypothetical protein